MSDTKQTETGTDQNALRFNFQPGESKELIVADAKNPSGDGKTWIISAKAEENGPDFDADTVVAINDFKPEEGKAARFTRLGAGQLVVDAPEAKDEEKKD